MSHIDDYPWYVLNTEEVPQTKKEVKRAYAKQLKLIDRSNVDEFQNLQQAYQYALEIVEEAKKPELNTREPLEEATHFDEHQEKGLQETFFNQTQTEYAHTSNFSSEWTPADEAFEVPQDLLFNPSNNAEYANKTDLPPELIVIYEQLEDPSNLSFKQWKNILEQADLNQLQTKKQIEEHILDVLSPYVIYRGEQLKFNRKVPKKLVIYLKERFDFTEYCHGENEEALATALAFRSEKRKTLRYYLSLAFRILFFIFSGFVCTIIYVTLERNGVSMHFLGLLIVIAILGKIREKRTE